MTGFSDIVEAKKKYQDMKSFFCLNKKKAREDKDQLDFTAVLNITNEGIIIRDDNTQCDLSIDQAKALRDWLNDLFPVKKLL